MPRDYLLPYHEWRRLSRRAHAAQQLNPSEVAGLFAVSMHRSIRLFARDHEELIHEWTRRIYS